MTCANTTNSSVNVTVKVTDTSAGVTASVVETAPVPSGGSLVVIGGNQKLVLETTDVLKVQSSASSSIDVIVSILEQT
jgi:predicted SPOUT superfamily RNA methylase MTH1